MNTSNYYWVRIYDYTYDRDQHEKGTMLDEYYLKDIKGGRDEVKQIVRERSAKDIKFAKPKNKDGIYAVVMDSNKFFYDRFYFEIDTFCFWCHNPVRGKASEFPRSYIGKKGWYEDEEDILTDLQNTAYFCSPDCKAHFSNSQSNHEGEFQQKEPGRNGDVFGYIYLIYNRSEDIYYIGQTRFMPFFRWQEHVKAGGKGDISDLSFSILAEVNRNHKQSTDENQKYLNSIEAWWISKYEHENHKVFNISKPKITIDYLKERFNEMVLKQGQLSLSLNGVDSNGQNSCFENSRTVLFSS